MNHTKKREFLIRYLLDEDKRYSSMDIPINEDEQKQLLRALFNIRMPKETTLDFMQIQDEYLQEENESRGITDYHDLTPIEKGIYLWQGDISTLKCDAIVNAANSQMLGCFRPNHSCIDNCIHTFAGIQLRATCFEIMEKKGHEEETGSAKITPAFNLPSKYVIHTVGPIVEDRLTERHEKLLESCYKSCLELAEKNGLKSIAFCCISTGVFMFPNQRAAEITVDTVKKFKEHSNIEVIFNVFKDTDLQIYRELLGTD